MRAVLNKFDPFKQVQNRLASLMMTGHDTSKIEIIIIGGTWSYLPEEYQREYLADIYNGLNQEIDLQQIEKYGDFFRCPEIEQREKLSLAEAIEKNQTSAHRCVGLTLETRPDFITEAELKRFREYGCTRVELGVQSLFDEVHEYTKRGNTVADIEKATYLLREAGFKIAYHLMPGLPGSDREKDMATVVNTFTKAEYLPDLLKIYPCVVTPFSALAKIHAEGKFKALTETELLPILIEMKKHCPRFTRIVRLARDIPSSSVIDGCKMINIRQLVQSEMDKQGIKCQCIRCREISGNPVQEFAMKRENYEAAQGQEIFLTYDEIKQDKLISLLRLRIPHRFLSGQTHFIPELQNCALIREVHTYGWQSIVGKNDSNSQHFGFGRKLIAEAERIAKEEYHCPRIAVIAGVGVREYYAKLGYHLEGTYMLKDL
ncbi:MAG TPA: tRNA uridine(34) 5-carboxymethylaminomethyl modification radical SAM/GNAT enzyme Elp3 [Candidatus Gracilibacteria bacterium]|nr:tRNA uridine(34) 5-carboxymethylaminomethyl modification radical SAM/GNAT enzyme Elp3 [Candidatus Gracilibacteria bacterium]